MGLEWLWRIKEEPHLWVRYWHDGRMLLRVVLTRILPLACRARFQRRHGAQESRMLACDEPKTASFSKCPEMPPRHTSAMLLAGFNKRWCSQHPW